MRVRLAAGGLRAGFAAGPCHLRHPVASARAPPRCHLLGGARCRTKLAGCRDYTSQALRLFFVQEAVAVVFGRQEVLFYRPHGDPAHQVPRRTCLVVGPGGAKPAETAAVDHCPGRLVVYVEVAGGVACKPVIALTIIPADRGRTPPSDAYGEVRSTWTKASS